MINYKENIRILVESAQISKDDIFEYELSPLSQLFEDFYQYCQVNLSEHCHQYNIQPALLYFRTSLEVNARAGIQNGHFIIGVNMQTIFRLYEIFYARNEIFTEYEYLPTTYKNLFEKMDVPPGFLMFQLATIFTYHHELGHLIQKSYSAENSFIEEYASDIKPFDINRHALELDADLNSIHSVCVHILEYFKKLNKKDQTEINLTLLLSIGASSILSFFLLHMEKSTFYVKEGTHPHPIVRISYVIHALLSTVEVNLPSGINISEKRIIQESIMLSNLIYKNAIQSNIVEHFIDEYIEHGIIIQEYIRELFIVTLDLPELVYNRFRN